MKSSLLALAVLGVVRSGAAAGARSVPWVIQFGKDTELNNGLAIAVDDDSSTLIVGGDTEGTLFGSEHHGDGGSHAGKQGFVTKYSLSSSGDAQFVWGKQFEGSGKGSGESVNAVTSHDGMIFAAGTTDRSFQGYMRMYS